MPGMAPVADFARTGGPTRLEGPLGAHPLLAEPPGSALGTLRGSPGGAAPLEHPLYPQNKVPAAPPCPPADDSYEDAEPPGHGTTGEVPPRPLPSTPVPPSP